MSDEITRLNHYVPVWYQKGFLRAGEFRHQYFDRSPEFIDLPGGKQIPRKALLHWGPKSCFVEQDLYTTFFGTQASDEIEKLLFGAIDDAGAIAIQAFVQGDSRQMHESAEDLFSYLDAQKLRTPKGLDWIRSRYPRLTQHALMREMQGLRLMHCTMWAEGVREIVSAKQSAIKFIISDHPVTIYNAAFPPTSTGCDYPNDPGIDLRGSQTIFALDSETCLILTHLEHAESPILSRAAIPRTNARYRGVGMMRTDAFIRSRELEAHEVVAINHVLKCRSKRYVAAAEREWLYPEKIWSGDWGSISQILLPRDELWKFGGEIYIGYKDGTTHYQDAFGRTSRAHEYLRKDRPKSILPNDYCGCGSGHKFKRCCSLLSEEQRPTWDVYSIRERNLMFCHRVQEILGLLDGKKWLDVRRELSDDQVKQIYQALESLWPEDTDLSALVPRPSTTILRALYLGAPDARNLELTVIGWLSYFDEIVVVNPFSNPRPIKPEFSPVHSPSKHKDQTLRNVFSLLLLEPYIRMGAVHLIPDPGDFNSQFRDSAWSMSSERTDGFEPDSADRKEFEKFALDDHRRLLSRMPARVIEDFFRRRAKPNDAVTPAQMAAYLKKEALKDPFTLLQEMEPGEKGAQFVIVKGYTLESAMFLASLTGSVIYTDKRTHWNLLHAGASETAAINWAPAIEAWQSASFPIEVDPSIPLLHRTAGRFGGIRATLRRVATAVTAGNEPPHSTAQLKAMAASLEKEWTKRVDRIRADGRMMPSIPRDGFDRAEVRRLLLTFGRSNLPTAVPLAILVSTSRRKILPPTESE